jgi:hypothetical protein
MHQNEERFSFGGAAARRCPRRLRGWDRAGERKTYWTNPLPPVPTPPSGDASGRVPAIRSRTRIPRRATRLSGPKRDRLDTTHAGMARTLPIWALNVLKRQSDQRLANNVADVRQSAVEQGLARAKETPCVRPTEIRRVSQAIVGRAGCSIQLRPAMAGTSDGRNSRAPTGEHPPPIPHDSRVAG